jgi:hypothetical protein
LRSQIALSEKVNSSLLTENHYFSCYIDINFTPLFTVFRPCRATTGEAMQSFRRANVMLVQVRSSEMTDCKAEASQDAFLNEAAGTLVPLAYLAGGSDLKKTNFSR